nr:M56 family metallopeptidase [uncultured Niameybacter sp.]
MNLVLQWILGSSGTAILIIILRYFLQKNIKATWVYTLWLVLLIRLLCPFMPSSSLSFLNPIQGQIDNQIIAAKGNGAIQTYDMMKEESFTSNEIPPSGITKETNKIETTNKEGEKELVENLASIKTSNVPNLANNYNTLWIKQVLIFIWGVGSLGMFFYYLVGSYLLYKKGAKLEEIKESNVIALYERCKLELKFPHPIKLCWADIPMSYGVIKKYIILPKGYSKETLENMMMHELMHHKRQDLLINILIAISLIIHWFNPIIWLALYLMKQDAELACDEGVIEILKNKEEYAMTLLKLSDRQQATSVMGSYMGIGKKQLKRRILAMSKMKKRGVIVGSLMVICVVAVALICLTGSKLNNKEVISNKNDAMSGQIQVGTIWESINKIKFENPIQHVELSPGGKNAYVFDDEPSLISSDKKDKFYIVSENGLISKDILGVVKEILEKELYIEEGAKYRIIEQSYGWDKEIFKMALIATGGDGWKNWTAKRSNVSLTIDPKNIENIDIQVSTETVGNEFKLSKKEQEVYDKYIQTKDVQVLKGLSSIETAKIIENCIKEGKGEEAYELLITSASKEEYVLENERIKFIDSKINERRYNSRYGLLDEAKVLPTGREGSAIIQAEGIAGDLIYVFEIRMEKLDGIWRMIAEG